METTCSCGLHNTYIDPETTSLGNDLYGNYGEFGSNPSSRNFGINLNVKF